MNNEDLHFKIDFLGGSGVALSSEEKTLLQNSLLILKKNNKFTHVRFWGKVYGLTHDYYIAQGYSEDFFKNKKTFSRYRLQAEVHFLVPMQ
jgi:radial spoke head protein 9